MAPQAKEVHIVHLQHSWVGGPMRCVARQAGVLSLYRSVLENKRSHGIGVAFGTDCELPRCSSYLVPHLRAVRVVTITALNQSSIHAVAVRTRKFSLLRGMASVAQLCLLLHQQEIDVLGFVGTMTGRTTDAISKMRRLREILRLQARLVAFGADGRGLGRRQSFETNNFADVASAINVCLRRSVTGLASVLLTFQQRRMWSISKMLVPYF